MRWKDDWFWILRSMFLHSVEIIWLGLMWVTKVIACLSTSWHVTVTASLGCFPPCSVPEERLVSSLLLPFPFFSVSFFFLSLWMPTDVSINPGLSGLRISGTLIFHDPSKAVIESSLPVFTLLSSQLTKFLYFAEVQLGLIVLIKSLGAMSFICRWAIGSSLI